MNTIRGKALLTVLALFALSLTVIAAVPSDADAPQTLYNEIWVSGALTGNRAGAFAYYALTYPGDGRVVTIELRFTPGDPATKVGAGFNVYGANGFAIGHGQPMVNSNGDAVFRLQYADRTPATWLVQVYNYIPERSINYGLVARGIPATGPQPTQAAPTAAPAPQPGEPPVPLLGSGSLLGSSGGAFTTYHVTVVNWAPDVVLTMTCWPDDANIARGVNFVVYGPSGEVARGATGAPGERKVTLAANAPGEYLVQVHNYIPGLMVSYSLRRDPAGQ